MPDCPKVTTEAFDSIINIRELPIERLSSWIFKHRLVELCTAIKGVAFQHIARCYGADRIYYLDPDILVASRLDGLERMLDRHSVLLTPHITAPEADSMDNVFERTFLKKGVFNLGFLAVRMSEQGQLFIDWWAKRLRRFCYDEVANGLFVDQRWLDLAPALFEDIGIVRDPEYNVSPLNLMHRVATGQAPYEIKVNGRPLAFYHFTGFDSGDHEMALDAHGARCPVLLDLFDWYIGQCEELGESLLGKLPCVYSRFNNGQSISDGHRILYRRIDELALHFPEPFDAIDPRRSYFHWYEAEGRNWSWALDGGTFRDAPPSFKQLIKAHVPEPALRLARSARKIIRRVAFPKRGGSCGQIGAWPNPL
jgi:hypothetical protein